jgi:hypothetical protein
MIIRVRRASAHPRQQAGLRGPLMRWPAWRLALAYWLCWVVVVGGSDLVVITRMHASPPLFFWPLLLIGGIFPALIVPAILRAAGRRRGLGGRDHSCFPPERPGL